MTLLNYSHTLIPGANENINDVVDMYDDAAAVINGGLDAENFTVANRPLTLLTPYRRLIEETSLYNSVTGTGTYYMAGSSDPVAPSAHQFILSGSSGATSPTAGTKLVNINSTTLGTSGLTPFLRLRAIIQTNGSGFGVGNLTDMVIGLYPYTIGTGTSARIVITLGTVISGSTITFTNIGINNTTRGTGSDFTLPSNGVTYCPGIVVSGSPSANGVASVTVCVEAHWI